MQLKQCVNSKHTSPLSASSSLDNTSKSQVHTWIITCPYLFIPDQQLQTVPGCFLSRSGELQLWVLARFLIPRPPKAHQCRCRPTAQDGNWAGCLVRLHLLTGCSCRWAGGNAAQWHDWTEDEHHDVSSAIKYWVSAGNTQNVLL